MNLSKFKKSLREDIRRQINKLSEQGIIQLVKFDCKMANAMFNQMNECHQVRWGRELNERLYHGLISECLPEGDCQIHGLFLDDTPMAWHIGFGNSSTFYYYKPIINPQFVNFSPGKLLLYFLMKDACSNGIRYFDFLRGAEEYKKHWGTTVHPVYGINMPCNRVFRTLRNFHCNILLPIVNKWCHK